MRGHKKTKESGFFEGDSTETEVMTNTLKRTKVYTTSGDGRRIVEYSQEDSLIPSQNREAEATELSCCAVALGWRSKPFAQHCANS
ncbi:hypothetical protein D910_06390 [Dendroctonus ponderosae]|uniref:Uncharacterized protein n=1 Tax=Dendroctonus ponderosae TaxID=77166 RepID=U4U7H0_DENPD|nr:hypothetical protein D910_06390 [Dendroctonus ponderosae]